MILYGNTLSPFVRKVCAYANEKGITLELAPGGMGQGGEAFREASPFGKMPAFRDPGADGGKDYTLADSTAIIAYLEAKFPDPELIPSGPVSRGRTVWYDEFADTIVVKMGGAMFFNRLIAPKIMKRPGDEAAAAAAEANELPPILDYLERTIPESGFLVEDRITTADLAVASPFANLGHIGVTVDAARWPRTAAYVDAILARPSFAAMIAGEKAFVASLG